MNNMLMISRARWSGVLLAWVLVMIIYIFPEAGLVIFMSINHWVRHINYQEYYDFFTNIVSLCIYYYSISLAKTNTSLVS